MAIDGKVLIDVKSNAGSVTKQFNKLDKSLNKVDTSAKKTKKSFESLKTGFKAAAIILATKKLFDMGNALVNVASDFEETNNKFAVVFQDIQGEAQQTAQVLSESYGLSNKASKELLSSTGDLLTGFGFTGESALDLSREVNKLAVDLASFTNFSGGAKGASEALTKALLGERDSVKALGISILEEDVKAKIKSMEATGELTDETNRQKKAIATLQIALEQSANAQGDYARSTGTYAQVQKELNSNWEDTQTILGQNLLPLFQDFSESLKSGADDAGTLRLVLEGIVETFVILTDVVNTAVVGFKAFGKVLGGIFTSIATFSTDPIKQAFKEIEEDSLKAVTRLQTSVKDLLTRDTLQAEVKTAGKSTGKAYVEGINDGIKETVVDDKIEELKEKAFDLKTSLMDAGEEFGDTLVSSIKSGENAFDSLRNFASNVLKDISSQLLRAGIGSQSAGTGIASLLPNIFGASKGGVIGNPGTPIKGFASGGIIPAGDNQIIGANTGEMMLTKPQQANLYKMANGSSSGESSQPVINIFPPQGYEAETIRRPGNETEVQFKRMGSYLGSPESDEALNSSDFRRSSNGVQAS